MSWFHDAFKGHYTSLYAHRDVHEADRCITMLGERLDPPEGPVLDLGCGAGRHLRGLAQAGRTGVGLDLSADLLAEASARGKTFQDRFALVRADMRVLPFQNDAFAAIYSLFTTFGYFGNLIDHEPLLQEISRALRPAGIWVLDYLNCQRVRAEFSARREIEKTWTRGPLRIIETRYIADNKMQVRKRVELMPITGREVEALPLGIGKDGVCYTESVALFDSSEIIESASTAEMEYLWGFGDYDGREFDEPHANRWILVFRHR